LVLAYINYFPTGRDLLLTQLIFLVSCHKSENCAAQFECFGLQDMCDVSTEMPRLVSLCMWYVCMKVGVLDMCTEAL